MRRFSERNYYAVLGVRRSASHDEIKTAYRARARTAHPDRGGSDEQFALVAEAWEVLGDRDTRTIYDAELALRQRATRPYVTRLARDDAGVDDGDSGHPDGSAETATAPTGDGLTDAQRWRRNKRRL